MGKTSRIDRVRTEELLGLQSVKEELNMLQTIKKRQAKWVGSILRRNSLLKHVIEGYIKGRVEVTRRRERRRKKLLMTLGKEMILEIDEGSIRSNSVKNWLWKRRWTCGMVG